MANDILNTGGTTTGNQVHGRVRLFHPNGIVAGRLGETYDPVDVETSLVSAIAAKYDARFDDPRYYTGDSA